MGKAHHDEERSSHTEGTKPRAATLSKEPSLLKTSSHFGPFSFSAGSTDNGFAAALTTNLAANIIKRHGKL